jgi:thioredoxin reductase (NADPH)
MVENGKGGNYYDVMIIGSGPAGWTAAVYSARANLKTVLFTGLLAGGTPGGQLMLTTEVENFPGFAHGIMGPDLMNEMREQAVRFGTTLVEDDVTRVDFSGKPLTAYIGEGDYEEAYYGKAVIVATGASALWLGLDSEEQFRGRGVSSCATCDGAFFRNKEIAVVGGGDTAMEEATYLTQHASKVTIIHRRDQLRASHIMQDRARKNPKIAWALNNEVAEIVGDKTVSGVRLRNTRTGEESELPVAGVFVAIGHRPNTEIFKGWLDMDDAGYLLTKEHTASNVPGVFVAGDVRDHRYRQAITAAGEGCMAALDAQEYITGEIWTDWAIGEQSAVAQPVGADD